MRRKFRNRAAGWIASGLALMSAVCDAQYRPAAMEKVDSVTKAGIYRVVLPPSFVARCRIDLSDLRIYDEDGKEAPYVLRGGSADQLGFLPIPDPKILQQDSSDHHSYYWLQYDDDYRIDRLSLVITSPALYKRTAVVSTEGDQGIAMLAATINIDPADSVFQLSPIRANRLLIEVANHDNAPLAITRVGTAQTGIYLLTYLEPDHIYRLMAGDPKVNTPDYDLHYFTDSIPAMPITIGLGPLQRFRPGTEPEVHKPRGRQGSGLVLWSLVSMILLLLLYVSVKLARAIDKKGKE
jgi:hypothetical protein